MKINSKYMGLSVAIVTAFLWSVFKIGGLLLAFLIIALIDEMNYPNIGNFNWVDSLKESLAQLFILIFTTGAIGWAVAEVYNDLNEIFSIKLK